MGGCAARDVRPRPIEPSIMRFGTVTDILPKSNDAKNLESYYLIWLDTTVKSPEFIETHDELRSIVNHVRIFESNTECENEFKKITNGKIFFIVNCAQSLSLLPIIHDHKQLHSIYIYHNGDNIDIERSTTQYKKIRGIYDSFITAKRYLEDDIKSHSDLDDPMVIDLSKEINDMEYQKKFSLFLKTAYVNAKDIYDKQTRKRLIKMCHEYYDDNEKEISFIEEFSHSYKPEQAISWYMRDSCLHRLLSRAFTDYDMSLLVDMYSFIVDINRNLQKQSIKQTSSLRVFRGQFISNERLSLFKTNINQIITMQCFFSAQTSRDETLHLLQTIEPIDTTFKRILFEIDVLQDYTIIDNHQSSTSKTVLFMLGAVFKIVDVTDTTIILSQYISRLNSNYDLANESPLIIKGILIYLKDGTKEAIRYFKEILQNQSSIDLATVSSIYGQLGYLAQKSGDLSTATEMYEQTMNHGTMQFNRYLFYLDQAAQYHATVLGDWEKAKTIWIQKLSFQNIFLSEEEKAQTYENLAHAALETKQHDKTLEYTLAAIQNLPNDHPHLPFLQQQLERARENMSKNTTN